MQAIDDDNFIELMSAGDSREAWKCTLCTVAGKGFFGCYRHIGCDAHKQALSGEAERIEAEKKKTEEVAAAGAAVAPPKVCGTKAASPKVAGGKAAK